MSGQANSCYSGQRTGQIFHINNNKLAISYTYNNQKVAKLPAPIESTQRIEPTRLNQPAISSDIG